MVVPAVVFDLRGGYAGAASILSSRNACPTSGLRSRPKGYIYQASHQPHVPALLRDASSASQLRHPHDPGASEPQRRPDHDDLYALRSEHNHQGDQKPARFLILGGLFVISAQTLACLTYMRNLGGQIFLPGQGMGLSR